MRSITAASLAAATLALLSSSSPSYAAPLDARNNGGGGKQKTSAGGTGPNPSVPGDDGGNGLTVTVVDPVSNNSIKDPTYRAISDFDYASFNLGLYQEWIELDLFHYGLARFSDAEWEEAGVNADYRSLINFFANQESGHAQLLSNILGPGAAKQCTYNYTGAFDDVRSYLNFNQQLTRWGESGVWGFLAQLNSRPSAQLLAQSIATEARQQMGFRQMTGSQAIDVFFEAGVPQSWAWTLLAPWIQSCPKENPRVGWSNYPALTIVNNPTLAYAGSKAAVSTNRTALVQDNEKIHFKWENPGKAVGPDLSYTTVKTGKTAKYAMFLQSYNASFVPLTITGENEGYAAYPSIPVFDTPLTYSGNAINGTSFIAIVDEKLDLTPYNLTLITKHMVAGPAIFQSG